MSRMPRRYTRVTPNRAVLLRSHKLDKPCTKSLTHAVELIKSLALEGFPVTRVGVSVADTENIPRLQVVRSSIAGQRHDQLQLDQEMCKCEHECKAGMSRYVRITCRDCLVTGRMEEEAG